MLIVISPAKTLDLDPVAIVPTQARWPADALRLARTARGLGLRDLRALMGISDDLARLNRDRFRAYAAEPAPQAVKPAVLAFAGDTYRGLDAPTLDPGDLDWAQDRLRILSGLYGLLRPLDGIQPYRLEMGSRLHTRRGDSLYAYWGDQIARALRADAGALGSDVLVNCASQEYFAAADRPTLHLGLRVIRPVFHEVKGGKSATVSFFAKTARGAMARFIIRHRLTTPEPIKDFAGGGYTFDPAASEADVWVFSRPAITPAQGRNSPAS